MSIFYVGLPKVQWIGRMSVPFFLSRNRAHDRKQGHPRSRVPWAMDSGGFTEINRHGLWRIDAKRYVREINYFADAIGNLQWAAPQDWMVEQVALRKTGKSLREHQRLTTENYLELAGSFNVRVPIIPALQGDDVDDYLWHVEHYRSYGVDLRKEPLVGVGSMCRRQALVGPRGGTTILKALYALGLKMHAFGYKADGLKRACQYIVSSDSMAWSQQARKRQTLLPGHNHPSAATKKYPAGQFNSCANCFDFMCFWRNELLRELPPACVQEHPLLTSPRGLYKLARDAQGSHVTASGAFRIRGMPLLEQEALFQQVGEILSVNERLDDGEEIEEDRDRAIDPSEDPGTYRAVPDPSLRQFLVALPQEMLPKATRDDVRRVLLLPLDGDDYDAYQRVREPSTRWGLNDDVLRHLGYDVGDDEGCPVGYPGPTDAPGEPTETTQSVNLPPSGRWTPDRLQRCMPKKKASRTLRQRKFDKQLKLPLDQTNVEGCDASTAGYVLRWGDKTSRV